MSAVELSGYMEFISHLPDFNINADFNDLIDAMEVSSIHTFGWPIAPVNRKDENQEPKPISGDKIKAELDNLKGQFGPMYDLWTLSKNGVLYIKASLFEDLRSNEKIFFDTRIVRTAETLLRTGNLYRALRVPEAENVSWRMEYHGLKGRELTVASSRRFIAPGRKCELSEIAFEAMDTVGDLKDSEVLRKRTYEIVKSITEVCGYFVPQRLVTDEIVDDFVNGKVN